MESLFFMVILASIHQSKESLLKTISVDNFKNLKKNKFFGTLMAYTN